MNEILELQKDGNRLTVRTNDVLEALFDLSIGASRSYFRPRNIVKKGECGIDAFQFFQRKGVITITFGDYKVPRDKKGRFLKRNDKQGGYTK